MTPEGFVLAAPLGSDPVDVVLGVFGWRTRRSRRRSVAEVRIVGAGSASLAHARRYTLCKRVCVKRSERSPC